MEAEKQLPSKNTYEEVSSEPYFFTKTIHNTQRRGHISSS